MILGDRVVIVKVFLLPGYEQIDKTGLVTGNVASIDRKILFINAVIMAIMDLLTQQWTFGQLTHSTSSLVNKVVNNYRITEIACCLWTVCFQEEV